MQDLTEYDRFCPNQPQLLISEAVCRSRRRANYPWCKGCQFNDDEKKKAAAGPTQPPPPKKPANQ